MMRSDCTEDLDSVTKLIFLQDFPSYTEIKTILSRKRREVIPADPKSMTDIDLSLPVFLYKDGESVVKGEQVLSDGHRIILFTTKEHLKILARARQILGDGTFRITPLLWCQTFIISAEVSKDVFVPVGFCLLQEIDMKKHKTEQDVKMWELEIDMKKYKTENNNMMKVILRLESENQKNQARIIDLEDEVWKINCEKYRSRKATF